MKITATQEFKKVVFVWNNELTECKVTALGVEDNEIDALVKSKVNEGNDFEGWNVSIEL